MVTADLREPHPRTLRSEEPGFLVSVSDDVDPVLGFPGWLTYLSDRETDPREGSRTVQLPEGFSGIGHGSGTLIEFTAGLESFTQDHANSLSRAISLD